MESGPEESGPKESGQGRWLVGRDDAFARVSDAVDAARRGSGGILLVSGAAGMGKTALLRAALEPVSDLTITWGTCVEGGGAPGFWPWTQAFNGLVRQVGVEPARALAGDDCGWVATLVPALGEATPGEQSERGRMLLLDAAVAWLQAIGTSRPVAIVLDDLQWADESTLMLLELLVRSPRPGAVCVLGAFRPDEAARGVQARLAALVEHADQVALTGLDRGATGLLAEATMGRSLEPEEVDHLFRRAGGHPFFTRELARALSVAHPAEEVPVAVRDAIERRVGRLTERTQGLLRVAAVTGRTLLPDVLAAVSGQSPAEVEAAAAEAAAAVLVRDRDGLQFAHDLFRETLALLVDAADRPALHRAIGEALAARAERTDVAAAEIARHFRSGVAAGSLAEAVSWTLRAVDVDVAKLALSEAAQHLRRLRRAVADAGLALEPPVLVEVLLTEADVLARSSRTEEARGLLLTTRTTAIRAGDSVGVARAALATAGLGSRFATRRDEVVGCLREALDALGETSPELRARVTATLARELTHSIAEQRDLAGPLSRRALELGRSTADPDVIAACLLARHDVLWTAGQTAHRSEVTAELVEVAHASGDRELLAQALLLHANVLLESGRAGFEPVLRECLQVLEELGEPRHRYTVETRRACVALLRGSLDEASARIDEAVVIGERMREPDTGNVRMSQRLELVRARADPDELLAFAAQAVEHWTGAPVHAHAVAAGFSARDGDLPAARRHVAAVRDLGTWRADRSYLWSVFVRELAYAAVQLDDRDLCAELLAQLEPLAGTCGVNGALVAFAGCHSHTAGNLAAALGDAHLARQLLEDACAVYERLGAAHLAEARADQAACAGDNGSAAGRALHWHGDTWEVTFDGRTVSVRDCKGLHDIAALVQRPGTDVHVLDLVASPIASGATGPVLDRTAAAQYRRRLTQLSEERDSVTQLGDTAGLEAIEAEHRALVAELRVGSGLGGRARQFANHPAERARKAVTARVRDAVRRLQAALPELGAHLDEHVVTGIRCRYTGEHRWRVEIPNDGR